MSHTMTFHRSTARVYSIENRGPFKPIISSQFRFIVRLAYACHAAGVDYDLDWETNQGFTQAAITAIGEIPAARPIPKEPKLKLVASGWKPTIWEAEYRLEAYNSANRMRPGFVIAHSCGLSLVHPSESGELGVTELGADEDIRENWLITHTSSGRGFGLRLTFKRAVDALLLAASFAVDWSQAMEVLQTNPDCKRAGNSILAKYGKAHQKIEAKRKLEQLEAA